MGAVIEIDIGVSLEGGGDWEDAVVVDLPALRQRLVDIPLLAHHFARQCSGARVNLTEEAVDRLLAYRWPGNVTELRTAVERGVRRARGRQIGSADLVF